MTSVSSSTSATSLASSAVISSSSGSSSTTDIDWSGLIEEAVQAKLAKADTIDTKITTNETKIAAYQDLAALLATLQSSAQALRAPSGSSLAAEDLFRGRTAYLTGNGGVDASSAVSVTTESGAQTGSYDLEIEQLAKAHKVAGSEIAGNSDELGYAGVISLGTTGGTTQEITVDAGMTLDEVAEAINDKADKTGVQASVLKVADGAYRLVLTASDTGKTIAATSVSGDDVLAKLGITEEGGAFADELQAPGKAIIKLDGVEITRDSNDIDDVVDGMTFHLYETTPDATSVNVEVGTDLSGVKTGVSSLVDAYNALRDFVVTQQGVTAAGQAADDAVLFADGTLNNITTAISNALNTRIGDVSLADLGLSFDATNHLSLDENTLDDALLDHLDDIKSMLSYQFTASSGDLMLLGRGSAAPSAFTLDVTVDGDGKLVSAGVGGDTSMFTISGTRIVGKDGTAFEGYSFVYAGHSSGSIDVSTTTGVAELLYNIAATATDAADGSVTKLVDNLQSVDTDLQSRSDDIRSKAETYRTNLTARYAQYQAAIDQAKSLKSYLQTLLDAMYSS
jgi:flagellar hook-associated protein 2